MVLKLGETGTVSVRCGSYHIRCMCIVPALCECGNYCMHSLMEFMFRLSRGLAKVLTKVLS